jgi:nitroreductase
MENRKTNYTAKKRGIRIYVGGVLSSDTFYGDDLAWWKQWAAYRILTCEMETSGLYTLRSLFGTHTCGPHRKSDMNLIKPVNKEEATVNENAFEIQNESATEGLVKTSDTITVEGGMTFDELLRNRRSTRNYQDIPVPVEVIQGMIKESTLAPSAGNGQPWKFIIVNNRDMLKRLSDESKKNILAHIAANPNDYAKKYQRMLQNESFNVFYNAPSLIMIVGLSNLKNLYVDCALVACYFMMAATSKGLGTCWVNLGAEIHDPKIRSTLGIPDNCTIVAPIILGYPKRIPPAPKRKAPEILKIIP